MAAEAELKLDDVDHAILAELTSDGRQSVTTVAQKVHVSRAHAYSRIAKLQDAGVITRYTAVIDPVKAGLEGQRLRDAETPPALLARAARPPCIDSRGSPCGPGGRQFRCDLAGPCQRQFGSAPRSF